MYRSRHCTVHIMYRKRHIPKWIFFMYRSIPNKNVCTEVVCTKIVMYRKRPISHLCDVAVSPISKKDVVIQV